MNRKELAAEMEVAFAAYRNSYGGSLIGQAVRLLREDAAAPQLKEALEQIGRPGNCCETPGCSIENPCCDAMIARAALLAAEGKGQ